MDGAENTLTGGSSAVQLPGRPCISVETDPAEEGNSLSVLYVAAYYVYQVRRRHPERTRPVRTEPLWVLVSSELLHQLRRLGQGLRRRVTAGTEP